MEVLTNYSRNIEIHDNYHRLTIHFIFVALIVALTVALSVSYTHTFTHIISLSLEHTHTLTRTHTNTLTLSLLLPQDWMYAAGWDHAMVKACDGDPLSDQIGEGMEFDT